MKDMGKHRMNKEEKNNQLSKKNFTALCQMRPPLTAVYFFQ